jgi:thiamine pyrophosphate-dependent acetolactate synthase large subunit-like protein
MDFKNPPIDIAALSTALGTPGRQINQPAEFIDCFSESLKSTGPTLLEVMVEPGPGS